jgi:hypothetical protein
MVALQQNMYYTPPYRCAVCGVSWEGNRRDGWLGTAGCVSDKLHIGLVEWVSCDSEFGIACSLVHLARFIKILRNLQYACQ